MKMLSMKSLFIVNQCFNQSKLNDTHCVNINIMILIFTFILILVFDRCPSRWMWRSFNPFPTSAHFQGISCPPLPQYFQWCVGTIQVKETDWCFDGPCWFRILTCFMLLNTSQIHAITNMLLLRLWNHCVHCATVLKTCAEELKFNLL